MHDVSLEVDTKPKMEDDINHRGGRMRNLRDLADKPSYSEINREERNLCAILFHLLHINDNMRKFMTLLKPIPPFGDSEEVTGVYVEYAYARDLWDHMRGKEANEKKRSFVTEKLGLDDLGRFAETSMSTEDFNKTFVAGTKISKIHIQNPGRWSVDKIKEAFIKDADGIFLSACTFKWAFNVKPDLVIHLDGNKAVCIEAKLESYEDQYPGDKGEKRIFEERFKDSWLGNRMSQTKVQRYLMEDILGLTSHPVFLRKSRQNKVEQDNDKLPQELTWPEVFNGLDRGGIPNYMEQAVESAIKNSERRGRGK
ncbi:MAG: hypothetical protein IT365_02785 [Candidatus Hydrogenedentes bacterium]|nr:hypothetical protein [Candidatus Hydrogenedentota bacterium]